jgi:hypothetical protein
MAMILSQTQANTTMELIKNIDPDSMKKSLKKFVDGHEQKSIDSPMCIDVQRKREFFLASQKKNNAKEVPLESDCESVSVPNNDKETVCSTQNIEKQPSRTNATHRFVGKGGRVARERSNSRGSATGWNKSMSPSGHISHLVNIGDKSLSINVEPCQDNTDFVNKSDQKRRKRLLEDLEEKIGTTHSNDENKFRGNLTTNAEANLPGSVNNNYAEVES